MCATASGKLYSWGYNEQWQLGWGQKESYHQGQQKPKEVKKPKTKDEAKEPKAQQEVKRNPLEAACGGQLLLAASQATG